MFRVTTWKHLLGKNRQKVYSRKVIEFEYINEIDDYLASTDNLTELKVLPFDTDFKSITLIYAHFTLKIEKI